MHSRALILEGRPAAGPSSVGSPALLAKGFRPFFLLAAIYAALGVPFWIATLAGLPPWRAPANPLDWHAHEMVFGYTGAVIAGFLLTAISKWTGRATLTGWGLAALCCLWLSGRVLPFVPAVPGIVGACLDFLFWLALLAACTVPIVAARSARNYGFIALLAAFALGAGVSHANRLGYAHGDFWAVRSFGVDLATLAMLVMTGRVVPSFTRNATRAAGITETPRYDRAAALAMVLATVLDGASAPPSWSAVPAGVAGLLILLRARHWGAKYTLSDPLLWILHLAHAWIGVGLALRGLVPFVPGIPPSVALHAVTAGGIGLLTLGMMTRVTLGHTGRMLTVPPSIGVAFGLLAISVVFRVGGPLVAPSHLSIVLGAAAALWTTSFGAYLVVYAGALATRRRDGQPG